MDHALRRHLAAGALAGLVGVAVFLVLHHFWILPIWSIAPVGAPIAAAAGALTGWAWHEARRHVAIRVGQAPRFVALTLLTLLPAQAFGLWRGPFDIPADASSASVPTSALAPAFAALALAVPVGALVGYALTRSARGTAAWALAGLATAIGVGHNTSLLGGTWPAVVKLWALMIAAQLAAALAFVGLARPRSA